MTAHVWNSWNPIQILIEIFRNIKDTRWRSYEEGGMAA